MDWIKRNIALLIVSLFAVFFLVVAIMQGNTIRELRLQQKPDYGLSNILDADEPGQTQERQPAPPASSPEVAEPAATNNAEEYITAQIKTETGSKLNIRAQPNTQGNVIGNLPNGTVVKVFFRSSYDVIDDHENYWYMIEANGIRGYAWGRYLE